MNEAFEQWRANDAIFDSTDVTPLNLSSILQKTFEAGWNAVLERCPYGHCSCCKNEGATHYEGTFEHPFKEIEA